MIKRILSITIIALALSACTLNQGQTGQPLNSATQQAMIDEAVRGTATSSAMLTQISQLQTQVAQPTSTATATATPGPTNTATPVPPTPTATQVPATATPLPPTATSTPAIPCNSAKFEGDVTVPDGTKFSPGSTFTKTWRLKNVGSCVWTNVYDVVFVGGDAMSGPGVIDLPGQVAPGQVIDISITFTAPSSEGNYRSNWQLRDQNGVLFGLGKQNQAFFTDIKVVSLASSFPLKMADTYCSAEWTSGGVNLPCPGKDNDNRGFVLRIDNPVLESGYQDDESVLLTNPQYGTDTVIRGVYPPLKVKDGYFFRAIIGCANKAKNCDVNFQLDYQIGSGSINTLATWHEVYDEKFRTVEVDLSSLAGKDVKFILTVLSNGASNGDRAQWLVPIITK